MATIPWVAFCLRAAIFYMLVCKFTDMWRATDEWKLLEKAFQDGVVSGWWITFYDLKYIWANAVCFFILLWVAFKNYLNRFA
jgi:hypothetical protein